MQNSEGTGCFNALLHFNLKRFFSRVNERSELAIEAEPMTKLSYILQVLSERFDETAEQVREETEKMRKD